MVVENAVIHIVQQVKRHHTAQPRQYPSQKQGAFSAESAHHLHYIVE